MNKKLDINITNSHLAQTYASQIIVGSAFAFINTSPSETDDISRSLQNFYGSFQVTRRVLSLVSEGQILPGFTIKSGMELLKFSPILLTEKEIYKFGQDLVYLLLLNPKWLSSSEIQGTAQVVVENNGIVYRTQAVNLADSGLTLVTLKGLPEGTYRAYWDSSEATDYQGNKAECYFSVVEYVLSPLQATLQTYHLDGLNLSCRLKIEHFNESLNDTVKIELWSGSKFLQEHQIKPQTPGIYETEFCLDSETTEKLSLRLLSHDLTAMVVIPGSESLEREKTLLSGLGKDITVSLMPQPGSYKVRGLYLNEDSTFTNTPIAVIQPNLEEPRASLQWKVNTQATCLLVLEIGGKVWREYNLGNVPADAELRVSIPSPGGIIVLGAWIEDQAWEGWSFVLAPDVATLEVNTPENARPGQVIEINLKSDRPCAIYLRVRDNRLSCVTPENRLATSLKQGLAGINEWGTLGYLETTLEQHPDFPDLSPPLDEEWLERDFLPENYDLAVAFSGEFAAGAESIPSSLSPQLQRLPRRDFADIAYCGVLQSNTEGEVSVKVQLPDAIATYTVEAFALSKEGRDWCSSSSSITVAQPVWAEFKLPAFIYPGDKCPATVEVGCESGEFQLKLLRDNNPIPYTVSGAESISTNTFRGERAKVQFVAQPGLWRVEVKDSITLEQDISEKFVAAIGQFKGIARRFQLLQAGEILNRRDREALHLGLLPSLERPFSLLCDATADYEHRCCEQTAAKLIGAVASLVAGGDSFTLGAAIKAGVARQETMYLPRKGFMMYPPSESDGIMTPDDYWGKMAAEHLLGLADLGESLFSEGIDEELSQALRRAIAMGQDTAKAYRLPIVPQQINTGRDAYRALKRNSRLWEEALNYARSSLEQLTVNQGKQPGAVLLRQEKAYCTATLIMGGVPSDLRLALACANELANSIDSNGRLYSTVDSVALISLMTALKAAGISTSKGIVSLDGQEMPLTEALEIARRVEVESIKVVEGTAIVEVVTETLEDWNGFKPNLPVKVKLTHPHALPLLKPVYHLGDTLELIVSVKQYEPGLVLQVCLPPSLSRLQGGAEVKRFSLDFAGKKEVKIPLVVTGHTVKEGEHWAVLVRNMFKEEQVGNPGLLQIHVHP
jgi:hypothetical protein